MVRFSITNSQLGTVTNSEIGRDDYLYESYYEAEDEEGEQSFALNYRNLPSELRFCLSYFSLFSMEFGVSKGKLVRLLLAIGLIQERPGGENMDEENIAIEYIEKLVDMGMLVHAKLNSGGNRVIVPKLYYKLFVQKTNEQDFLKASASSISHNCRVYVGNDTEILPIFSSSLAIHSLIISPYELFVKSPFLRLNSQFVFPELKLLRVLDLHRITILQIPDEVGDLVHLRYLGLVYSGVQKPLPETIGDLRNLQTLVINSWFSVEGLLPTGVLNLIQLKYLKTFSVPPGIGRLTNLHTLTGLHLNGTYGGCIASELSSLTQLKKLKIKLFQQDHAVKLFSSIMKMRGLLSLSLQAESYWAEEGLFSTIESFLPPPLLQELCLVGILTEMPDWIGSMQNLTKLELRYSRLSDDSSLILQFLPNLKHLLLFKAYDGKQIGREFCGAGGFPNLEYLGINSDCLVEWTELENGALPSLKQLCLWSSSLMFLPEGLQNITTLQKLDLFPMHPDLERRLSPAGGKENYKIKHIPLVRFPHPEKASSITSWIKN